MFFKVVGRVTIRFFRKLGRATIKTSRFGVRHPFAGLLSLIVIGGLAFLLIQTSVFGLATPSDTKITNDPSVTTGNPRESSVKVLKGLSGFNASLMWETFTDDYKQSLQRNGMDVKKLQQLLDKARGTEQSRTASYGQFTWQGFGNLRDGSGQADVFAGKLTQSSKETVTHYAVKIDNKDKVRELVSDDPLLGNTLFATTVRSAEPLVKPSDNSTRLLIGLTKGNATEIWNNLGEDYRTQLTDQGSSIEAIQTALDKGLKSDDKKVVYDHFTMKTPATDTNNPELFTGFVSLAGSSQQYNYSVGHDTLGQVSEIATNDPLLQTVFFGSLVHATDPTLKPRSTSTLVLRGLSDYSAREIWLSLSDDYKTALTAEGFNQAAMDKSIKDTLKELDAINERPTYLRFDLIQVGTTRDTGAPVEIYNVGMRINGRESQTSMVVKFDSHDKVSDIIAQDPIVTAAFRKTKSSASLPQSGTELLSPSFVAERLMAGLTTFDTEKIWASFSITYQKELKAKGISPATMAATIDKFKQSAIKDNAKLSYVGYSYLNGKSYPAGNAEASYSSTLQYGDQAIPFQYLIVLDSDNKIQAISTTDQILNLLLGRQQTQTTGGS